MLKIDSDTQLPNFPLLLGFGAGSNIYSTDIAAKCTAGAKVEGVDIVSGVSETILSFIGARVKIDTDESW